MVPVARDRGRHPAIPNRLSSNVEYELFRTIASVKILSLAEQRVAKRCSRQICTAVVHRQAMTLTPISSRRRSPAGLVSFACFACIPMTSPEDRSVPLQLGGGASEFALPFAQRHANGRAGRQTFAHPRGRSESHMRLERTARSCRRRGRLLAQRRHRRGQS